MARWTSFLGSGKTLAASSVTSFTGNDLPSAGVVAFHFVMNGSGNTLANISRVRVKADSRLIVDISQAHLRKWLERFSQNGFALPTTYARFTLPFNLMDIVDDDLADICQFPRGAVPTVEITTGASAGAGTVYAGWTQTDQAPEFYSTLIGSAMNIGASITNANYPIASQEAIRGVVLDTTGLKRLKLELNGFAYHQLTGVDYQASVTTGDMTLAASDVEDGAGSSGGVTITSQAALRVPMIQASSGASRLEMDTASGWSAANELTLWGIGNQN